MLSSSRFMMMEPAARHCGQGSGLQSGLGLLAVARPQKEPDSVPLKASVLSMGFNTGGPSDMTLIASWSKVAAEREPHSGLCPGIGQQQGSSHPVGHDLCGKS